MSVDSKVERLHAAGVIVAEHFSDSDKQVIDKLSDEEIEVLVKLRKKVGNAPAGKDHLRPNIFV